MAISNAAGGFLGMVASPALFGVLLDRGLPTVPLALAASAALVMIFLTRRLAART